MTTLTLLQQKCDRCDFQRRRVDTIVNCDALACSAVP